MVKRTSRGIVVAAALVAALLAGAGSGCLTEAAEGASKEKPALVDINTATTAELEKLPGVGPSLAKRIVEFREKNGAFQSVEDLLKVQGIGEKSLARFREFVTASKPAKK